MILLCVRVSQPLGLVKDMYCTVCVRVSQLLGLVHTVKEVNNHK